MRTRSTRRATKMGIAAVVSFSLIAAACGGSDDDSGDGGDSGDTQTTEATEGSESTDGGDSGETETTEAEIEEDEITQDTAAPDEAIGDPVPGGTLRYGLEADVDGLNPTSSALSSPGLMMSQAVFDSLVTYDVDGNYVPYLAESVEPLDGDFSTWQLKLREGVTFHDGTPVNAEAVQINFELQRADPLVGLAVRPYYPETDATTLIDDLTIQYNLLEPNAQFPKALTGQLGYLASPTWVAAAAEDPTLNQQPVGSGPFVFDSRSADSVTRFVRNDSWWNGSAFLDAVEFVPVTDPDSRADLFLNGDLQAMQTSNPATVEDLRSEDAIQNIIDETGEETFVMINSQVPPFDDVRARQALAFATPKQQYLDLITLGIARSADQMFIPESKFYNPDVVQQADMPDEALALVTEYCAERGTEENPLLGTTTCSDGKINIEYQWSGPSVVGTQTADLMNQAWGNAGFNVTFDELPQDDQIQDAALGSFNAVLWRQFGAEDPVNDRVWLGCDNIGVISLNWPKFCDEARDTLMAQGAASTDEAERIGIYQEVSANINAAYTYVFLNHTIWDNAFAENVLGVCDRVAPTGESLLCVTNGRNWFDSIWINE